MSYDVTKLTQLGHLKSLAEKVAAECATKTELAALSTRVDEIVSTGGEPNVLVGVKVNGTALSIAEKMVDILIATGTGNGTLAVNKVDVPIKGLAALAYKAQVSKTDLDSALQAVIDAKAAQTDLDAAEVKIASIQSTLTTLQGSGEGSIDKAIDDAINEFATKVSDDDVVNSFKELVDWVAQHGSEASEMSAGIQENKTAIATLKTYVGTLPEAATSQNVVAYIAEAITKLNIGQYATTAAMNAALANKVDKVDGSRLMTNDEGTKLSGIAAGATKVAKSETNGNVKINDVETVVYTLPSDVVRGQIATTPEVTEMLNEVFAAQE